MCTGVVTRGRGGTGGTCPPSLLFKVGVKGFPLVEVEHEAVLALSQTRFVASVEQHPYIFSALETMARQQSN